MFGLQVPDRGGLPFENPQGGQFDARIGAAVRFINHLPNRSEVVRDPSRHGQVRSKRGALTGVVCPGHSERLNRRLRPPPLPRLLLHQTARLLLR